MSLLPPLAPPTNRQLRQFGTIGLVAVPLLAWWWSGGAALTTTLCGGVGGVLGLAGWLRPESLGPLFRLARYVSRPIGVVVGECALLATYYCVLTPVGLLQRLCGQSRVERHLAPEQASYWSRRSPPAGVDSYRKQW